MSLSAVREAKVIFVCNELFAKISSQALKVYDICRRFVHLNSSSCHLHGVYEGDDPHPQAISLTHSYSRDMSKDSAKLKSILGGLLVR